MKGFKTYLGAAMATLLGAGAMFGWWDIAGIAERGDEVLVAMGVVMAAFRSVTTTSPGSDT